MESGPRLKRLGHQLRIEERKQRRIKSVQKPLMISQTETARKTETAAGKNAPAAMFY